MTMWVLSQRFKIWLAFNNSPHQQAEKRKMVISIDLTTEIQRMPTRTASIQHCTGGPSQCSKESKRNKKHIYWKGRNSIWSILAELPLPPVHVKEPNRCFRIVFSLFYFFFSFLFLSHFLFFFSFFLSDFALWWVLSLLSPTLIIITWKNSYSRLREALLLQ